MNQAINPQRRHVRPGGLPHFFCPGCGCGQVLNYFCRALDEIGLDLNEMVLIGGVGCAARIPVYLNADALHGVHGRTLAWASGIKLIKPELPVVVFAGDGDAAAIGGNHFIQAARRNLDVTMVIVNNMNFAMTGGQVAPTTFIGATTTTTPYGSSEPPFDLCQLAVTAGASYVSRWTTAHAVQTIKALQTALQHRGFSVVEILSQCPTHFGRYSLGSGQAENQLKWFKEKSLTIVQAQGVKEEEKTDKFILGEFVNKNRPVFAGSTVYAGGGE